MSDRNNDKGLSRVYCTTESCETASFRSDFCPGCGARHPDSVTAAQAHEYVRRLFENVDYSAYHRVSVPAPSKCEPVRAEEEVRPAIQARNAAENQKLVDAGVLFPVPGLGFIEIKPEWETDGGYAVCELGAQGLPSIMREILAGSWIESPAPYESLSDADHVCLHLGKVRDDFKVDYAVEHPSVNAALAYAVEILAGVVTDVAGLRTREAERRAQEARTATEDAYPVL